MTFMVALVSFVLELSFADKGTQYLESSLQRVQVRLHRILIRPAFSFMSLRAMRYQPWVAGLVYRSYQFFDMAAINNILRWELIEVTLLLSSDTVCSPCFCANKLFQHVDPKLPVFE